ncbi:MAG TPA: hypothetical protein VNT55_20965 [Baekduia sp.]|nr:hypothetical protein [Baekduia sp.]
MRRRLALVTVVATALAAGGCGATSSSPAAAPLSAAACRRTDAAELLAVGHRIYAEAATGRIVTGARRRLARSTRLSRAVAADDGPATLAALRPLLKHQITRIAVWGPDGRLLATLGRAPALAPSSGTIADPLGLPVGRYTLAVGGDAAIAGEIAAVTGAPTRIAPDAAGGASTAAFPATAFPSGPLRVAMTIRPALLTACAPTPATTRMAVVGQVGQRLLDSEQHGRQARRVLNHVTHDPGFRRAVAHRDPVALRAAIIRFFRTRSLHVVRIRATTPDGTLIGDVGGPFVLSPLSGPVRSGGGRLLGRVTLSVQDDTGYIKLMRRFTGAAVVLHASHTRVPGSARPPASAHLTTTLTGTAFPAGPLDIALALPI